MSRIRVGVVGTGFSGQSHLRALRLIPRVDVVAVADHTIEKARKAAEQTGVDQSYADPAVMLQEASVDAIHNCTPNSAHAEVTSAALARGIHVLSEKPLGMASRESASLVQAASRADVVQAFASTTVSIHWCARSEAASRRMAGRVGLISYTEAISKTGFCFRATGIGDSKRT